MIVANQVGENLAFDQDQNKVVVFTKDKQIEFDLCHKTRLAGKIIELIATNLQNTHF